MATKYAKLMVGSYFTNGTGFTSDNRYLIDVPVLIESKSPPAKRKRPVGTEQLFSGTNVQSVRDMRQHGVAIEMGNLPSPAFSYSMTTIGTPSLGQSPPSNNIEEKWWSNQIRSKILNMEINLAQTFAERKQLESMFVDYGGRLIRASRFLRKGDPVGVLNTLLGTRRTSHAYAGWKDALSETSKTASEALLAYQYGIRPLISDVKGAVSEYYKVRSGTPLIRKFTASAHASAGKWGGKVQGNQDLYTTQWAQKASVVCWAQFTDGAQAYDTTAARLGLTNPALLAWELIPYSFVIDWFLGVGNFLEASATITGVQRVGIHVTTRTTETSVGSNLGGTSSRYVKTVSREFKTSLPVAHLHIKSNPLSLSHTTSALALIRQAWR